MKTRSQRWAVRFTMGGAPVIIEADFWHVLDAKEWIAQTIGLRPTSINKIID